MSECTRCGLTTRAANAGVLCDPPHGSDHLFETAQPCPTCGGRGWLEVWSWVSHEWVRDACGECIDGRVLNTTPRSHR